MRAKLYKVKPAAVNNTRKLETGYYIDIARQNFSGQTVIDWSETHYLRAVQNDVGLNVAYAVLWMPER